jgi:hypothetical protein
LTGKVTSSKFSYNREDIENISNTLVVLFKDERIQTQIILIKAVKKYIDSTSFIPNSQRLKIFRKFSPMFGTETSDILLKSLSYFILKENINFVNRILQAIDIFTKKENVANEIFRAVNPPELVKDNEQEIEWIEGNNISFFNELKEKLEESVEKKQVNKCNNVFRPGRGSSFMDRIVDYLEKFNKSKIDKTKYTIDSNLYVWRFTKKIGGNEIVYWAINPYEEIPNGAHPKYSRYIKLFSFVQFVVVEKDFFARQNALESLPSLDSFGSSGANNSKNTKKNNRKENFPTLSSSSSQVVKSCWNGNNKSIMDAASLPNPIVKKPVAATWETFDKFDKSNYDCQPESDETCSSDRNDSFGHYYANDNSDNDLCDDYEKY